MVEPRKLIQCIFVQFNSAREKERGGKEIGLSRECKAMVGLSARCAPVSVPVHACPSSALYCLAALVLGAGVEVIGRSHCGVSETGLACNFN